LGTLYEVRAFDADFFAALPAFRVIFFAELLPFLPLAMAYLPWKCDRQSKGIENNYKSRDGNDYHTAQVRGISKLRHLAAGWSLNGCSATEERWQTTCVALLHLQERSLFRIGTVRAAQCSMPATPDLNLF
jgi:hypothetical protein